MTEVVTSEAEAYSPDHLSEARLESPSSGVWEPPDCPPPDAAAELLGPGLDAPVLPGSSWDSLNEDSLSAERVSIVDDEGLRAMGELARSHGYLWIQLAIPGPQHRGRLGLYLEEAIESELEERGALSPGIQASTGLDASLSDQLYRARLVEMRGIALGIPSLEGITNLGRSLDAEDSAVLRWWIAAAESRPVRLVISRENSKLRVYPSPVLFETLFEVAPAPVTPMPPSLQMAESSQTMDLADLPPSAHETNVLGTKVASLDDLNDDESHMRGDFSDDVELPDLDRALGLSEGTLDGLGEPRRPLLQAEAMNEAHDEGQNGSTTRAPRATTQLALNYSTEPGSLAEPHDAEPAESPTFDPFEATEPSYERVEPTTSSPRMTRIASPAPPAEEPIPDRGDAQERSASTKLESSDFDDLDAEEFLRTLKEDSERAPEVRDRPPAAPAATTPVNTPAANEQARVAGALPTKRISKNPFIRLADPAEAIETEGGASTDLNSSDTDQQAQERASIERRAAALAHVPVDGRTMVDLPIEDKHEKTLSGAAAPDPNDPFNQLAAREWRNWVKNLEAARGPKPLSVIERMFVTDYTRLREAVRRGVADVSAEAILDEWRTSFSKSYSEAFNALRVRGKRPTMVLDLPELAARLGRLQGAKRVQLLLIDGLRFDLGLMVQERMRDRADAALTERLLLWSALPTNTAYQLELLGKGPDGLKMDAELDEPPALVARGAGARVPRRVKTGSLELLKLDVVEDALRKVGPPILERMESIAADTAACIVEHLSRQPPRTMVVVFGDHGFSLDPRKAGTTEEVVQGGSTPEEVLVPAFAWLTGAVH